MPYRIMYPIDFKLDRTYQINTGGNTDFLNMLNRDRLDSKKESKTEAVQAVVAERMDDRDIHIGPSDYVPWQNDNKLCKKFLDYYGRQLPDMKSAVTSALTSFTAQEIELLARLFHKLNRHLVTQP